MGKVSLALLISAASLLLLPCFGVAQEKQSDTKIIIGKLFDAISTLEAALKIVRDKIGTLDDKINANQKNIAVNQKKIGTNLDGLHYLNNKINLRVTKKTYDARVKLITNKID